MSKNFETIDGILESLMERGLLNKAKITTELCSTCGRKLFEDGKGELYCAKCLTEKETAEIAKEHRQRNERAKRNEKRNLFIQNSLISQDLLNATFESYDPQNESQAEAKEIAQTYADTFSLDEPDKLLFYGSYGTGKSHLAKSIADLVMNKERAKEHGYSALFINLEELHINLVSSFNDHTETTQQEIMQEMIGVDLLVLDDMGSETSMSLQDYEEEMEEAVEKGKKPKVNASRFQVKTLFNILEGRAGRNTVLTSNFSPKQLLNIYGERVFDRIMYQARTKRLKGDSYRLRHLKG